MHPPSPASVNIRALRLSLPVRKDIVYLSLVGALWLLIILWQGVDGWLPTKLTFTLLICLSPFWVVVRLIPYRGAEGKKKRMAVRTGGASSKPSRPFSVADASLFGFVGLFFASLLTGQSPLLLAAFFLLLTGNVYEAIRTKRYRKMGVFFRRVYLSGGLLPYLLSLGTVGLTVLLLGVLSVHAPEFLHYQWQPFSGVDAGLSMLPLISAMESGYRMIIYGTVALILVVAPYLAYEEERLFRYGRSGGGQILRGSLIFGPVHVISGIPLYAGLALIVTGLLFSLFYRYHYRRLLERYPNNPRRSYFLALFPATALHTVHNSLIFITFLSLYTLQG
jgi:hypothetical protein